jgi:hypothetical protein
MLQTRNPDYERQPNAEILRLPEIGPERFGDFSVTGRTFLALDADFGALPHTKSLPRLPGSFRCCQPTSTPEAPLFPAPE